MNFVNRKVCMRWVVAAGAVVLSLLPLGGARAQDKTYTMKITLATLNDQIHAFAKNYAAAVEKDSGGRIKTEIYPASQLGAIPRQTEGVQFGAIQCQVVPPEFLVGIDERFEVMAAPGLVRSMAQGQKLAADPQVLKLMLSLGADKGLHGVGLFMVNPAAIASRTAIRDACRLQGQEDPDFRVEIPKRGVRSPWRDARGDESWRRVAGAATGRHRRCGRFDRRLLGLSLSGCGEIRDRDRPTGDLRDRRDQQEVVRHAAPRSAANRRSDRGPRGRGDQPAGGHRSPTNSRKTWTDAGGELIKLPPDEQSSLLELLSSVGADVSKEKPLLSEAYKIVSEAAVRTR